MSGHDQWVCESLVLTDEQLAILAAYEDEDDACWYLQPEFRLLLEDGCAEFDLMRAMAIELVEARRLLADANERIAELVK